MLIRNNAKWNVEEITAPEISAAIRYLDEDLMDENRPATNTACVLVPYVIFMFILSSLTLAFLYCEVG